MTDNELLLQISNIVNSNTKYLEYRIDQLDEKLSNRIDAVEIKLSNRIDELDERLSARIDELDQKIEAVDKKLSHDIKRICINIENEIKPRLQTIESCYVDTNRRHNANIEKIDKLQIDMEVVQSVLKDHIEYIHQQTA